MKHTGRYKVYKEVIDYFIQRYADEIIKKDWLDPVKLLKTIAILESGYGENIIPRFEPAFYVGGKYWKEEYTSLALSFGANIACSYGVFQILYFTARRFGYEGDPIDLSSISVSLPYVIRFVNHILKNVNSLEEFADAYNSGNARDNIIPHEYIKKFIEVYRSL